MAVPVAAIAAVVPDALRAASEFGIIPAMKLIGEKIFAKDAEGRLLSRIGTMFFRTPGLVTAKGVHAMQRLLWIEELSKERALSPAEEEAELAESVDLIFTDDQVLIRPDPERMDLAFRADAELQKLVSKRVIRYLNTSSAKVRTALRERGENWRMSRHPVSADDMSELIAKSRVAIGEMPIYYYNHATGTRYVTASSYDEVGKLPPDAFRRQVAEIVNGLSKRNRQGQPEIDLFPLSTPPAIRRAFRELKVAELDDAALKAACLRLDTDWRMQMPAELRDETVANVEWRNEMCRTLMRVPNDTGAEERELVAGIAPEFYRQIEWLPGVRVEDGRIVFDEVYDEAARTQDPKLLALCDRRVKAFLFNTTRLFGKVTYINIGRIAHSLSRTPIAGSRRGLVYIMQYQEAGADAPSVKIIRLLKWGVAEHLDEGKSLLQANFEADEYSDFVLDRRLMCRQLGMNLPNRLGVGQFSEKYKGANQYNGCVIQTRYLVRSYEIGLASDKIPAARLRNPVWAQKFAFLMGQAAATDAIVGRRSSTTKELLFDRSYEVVRVGADDMPSEICVTDHAGSFVNYESPIEDYVAEYAAFAKDRKSLVAEYPQFAQAYAEGFRRKLVETQEAYRGRKIAFDELFCDRPYDTNGSGAYRWACALRRLDACDPARLFELLKTACEC